MFTKQKLYNISKQWYKYYQRNINSKEFREYEEKVNESFIKNITNSQKYSQDFLSTSLDDIFAVAQVTICDVLNNVGLAKLINRIKSLPKKDFKYDCHFLSAPRPKYDYVRLQYTSSGYGILADITFLNNKYIKSVEILKSQINNYQVLVEYIFTFSKAMNADLCNQFIYDNIVSISKKDYHPAYRIDKNNNNLNFNSLIQTQQDFLPIICQHYITTYLYSEEGYEDKLPSLTFCTRKKIFNIKDFPLGHFGNNYYNKEQNYIIKENFDNDEFMLFAGNNLVPRFYITDLICRYGNSFYYLFLGKRFLNNFEYDFSKYATGRKKIENSDLSKLLDYYYGLVDNQHIYEDIVVRFKEKWLLFQGEKNKDYNPDVQETLTMYKNIFHNAYEHFKAKTDLSINKTGRIISYTALAISIISVVVSIFFQFCGTNNKELKNTQEQMYCYEINYNLDNNLFYNQN